MEVRRQEEEEKKTVKRQVVMNCNGSKSPQNEHILGVHVNFTEHMHLSPLPLEIKSIKLKV